MPDSRACLPALLRCGAAPARSSKDPAQAGGRFPDADTLCLQDRELFAFTNRQVAPGWR